MRRALIAALTVVAMLLIAVQASATNRKPVGTRINVARGTPTVYPAGQPFHVNHGWSSCVGSDDDLLANGRLGFELDVDGVRRAATYVDVSLLPRETTGFPCDVVNRTTVVNFPAGLSAGSHTFTGHWIGPCKPLVADGQYGGSCANPAEVVEANFSPVTLTVSFTP